MNRHRLPFFIVSNSASGSGDANHRLSAVRAALDAAGREHTVLTAGVPHELPRLADEAARLARRHDGAAIAAGGDGTMNAVAQAAHEKDCVCGMIPLGTFNYTGRAHHVPLDPTEAVRALLKAHIKPIGVGYVNGHLFMVNASVGLYPELLEEREQFKRKYGRTRAVAYWSGLKTLLTEERKLAIEIDYDHQREVTRTCTLFVGNNPLQLAELGLKEALDIHEHRRLAAVLVKPTHSIRLLWLSIRGALGQLGQDPNVRSFSFQRMTVRTHRRATLKLALDGEIVWLQPPLVFEASERPLRFLVPNEGAVG